jgi:hypothetical protein
LTTASAAEMFHPSRGARSRLTSPSMPGYCSWMKIIGRVVTRKICLTRHPERSENENEESIKESEAKKNPRKTEDALRSRRRRRGCPEPRG